MPLTPLYTATDLHPAYELRYGWTGWTFDAPFPLDFIAQLLPKIAPEWENDGIRVLESSLAAEQLQLTLSARPQVSPITLAARVKGRLQHNCRRAGNRVAFSRKVAIRSIGHNHRQQVEGYIARQAAKEALVDERFRDLLQRLSINRPEVDLSQPSETNSGRYWYNLHLVLVAAARYRMGEEASLLKVRDACLRIADQKGYAISTLAVMPDHVHMALRGAIAHSPEDIALAFLNNLAFALGQCAFWESGYYAGTFSEYDMDAVRSFAGGRRS